jgi:hypothetical protein
VVRLVRERADLVYDATERGWTKACKARGMDAGTGGGGVQCYTCGEKGHISTNCPNKKGGKGRGKKSKESSDSESESSGEEERRRRRRRDRGRREKEKRDKAKKGKKKERKDSSSEESPDTDDVAEIVARVLKQKKKKG